MYKQKQNFLGKKTTATYAGVESLWKGRIGCFVCDETNINAWTQTISDPSYLFQTTPSVVGYVLGWMAAVTYLASRFPQIIKNVSSTYTFIS